MNSFIYYLLIGIVSDVLVCSLGGPSHGLGNVFCVGGIALNSIVVLT